MANDVATLIARIRARVNITDTAVLPDAEIAEALNDAQERMVQAGSEWLSMDQSLDLTYGATDDGILLPANFAKEAQVSLLDATQGAADRLTTIEKTERGAWIARFTSGQALASVPLHYYLWAAKLYLVPQPSAAITVRLDYFGPPAELSLTVPNTTSEFTLRFFRTLKWGALSDIWDFLGQEDMALAALSRFEQRLDRAKAVETAARVGGPKRIRGA